MAYTQPTVYARREPTNDSVAIHYLDAKTLATCKDVIITTIEIAAASMQTFHSSINAPLAETATSLSTVSATNSFGFRR